MAVSRPSTNRRIGTACAALVLSLHMADGHAQSPDAAQIFSFRGFGTAGLAHSSEGRADFRAHDLQEKGAGLSDDWSAAVDSRLGLQLDADFTSRLSAVLQVVTEQRHDGEFRPAFEWANVQYGFTPELRVRAGRIVLPAFMTSDTRKVGYAQPWVRPPVELYSLMPVTSSDGVDLSYALRLGEFNHTLKAAYGGTNADIPGSDGQVKVRDGWLLANTVEYGAATFHVAYSQSRLTLESYRPLFDGYRSLATGASQAALAIPPLAAQYRATAAQAQAAIDRYEPESRRMKFFGVGAGYDPGDWFVMGEWGQTDNASIYGKRRAWYATTGYRWRSLTPYASYAKAEMKTPLSDPGIATNAVDPAGLNTSIATLNGVLNDRLSAAPVQKTLSFGLRWDFARSAAFKLQYDHSKIPGDSPGTLERPAGTSLGAGSYDVWSATVDFVF